MIRNLRYSHNWLSFGKFQDTERFLIHCERHFSLRLPPSGGTWKYAKAPSTKKTWRDSLPIYMLLFAVSVLVVAQSSSEIPAVLMNNPVYLYSPYGLYGLYRASVPVQGCTLTFFFEATVSFKAFCYHFQIHLPVQHLRQQLHNSNQTVVLQTLDTHSTCFALHWTSSERCITKERLAANYVANLQL